MWGGDKGHSGKFNFHFSNLKFNILNPLIFEYLTFFESKTIYAFIYYIFISVNEEDIWKSELMFYFAESEDWNSWQYKCK